MSDENPESDKRIIAIPVRWDMDVDLPTVYVNHFLVTHGGGEFYLVFGESMPPVILDPEKEPMPESVRIRPVARIVVSPANMFKIAEAIRINVQNFMHKIEELEAIENQDVKDE